MTSTFFNTGYSLARNSSKVIQPPGGQSADIFGRSSELAGGYSSASSQAGSDVANQRIHIDADQQSIASSANQMPVDALMKQQQQQLQQQQLAGQSSPTGSLGSSLAGSQQQQAQQIQSSASSMIGDAYQPMQLQQQQQMMQQQAQINQQLRNATRTPKKTIPVLRRNPITGEIIENPAERQQPVVRVRQPPGGHSSGIF